MPSTQPTAASFRPSADVPVPVDVTDVMLWRIAFDVTVEHRRDPDGNCTNLRCAGQRGPCASALQAQRALQAARRPATTVPGQAAPQARQPAVISSVVAVAQHADRAVGRAAVAPPDPGRFTGWFTRVATAATDPWRTRLLRRTPGAALTAA